VIRGKNKQIQEKFGEENKHVIDVNLIDFYLISHFLSRLCVRNVLGYLNASRLLEKINGYKSIPFFLGNIIHLHTFTIEREIAGEPLGRSSTVLSCLLVQYSYHRLLHFMMLKWLVTFSFFSASRCSLSWWNEKYSVYVIDKHIFFYGKMIFHRAGNSRAPKMC
jgi:hypothetical protein